MQIQCRMGNAIIPFENTDDDYSDEARFWYGMWATTGNELEDVGNGIKNLFRGLLDAAVDLVDGVFSLALFLVIDGCVPDTERALLPDWMEERVTGMEDGIAAIITDPVAVVEAMGQSMTDTYEEEGLAYAVGYISLDVITEIAATKGAGGAKGAAKAADTAADAAGAAKKVDTVADAAKAADKATDAARAADKVSDAAGAAKKVDTVTDAAKAADKATDAARAADKVSDAAGAAKKVDTVTDAAGAAKKADTATDAAGAVYTVDKVEETADAAKKVDGLEVKGGTAEVEAIPEVNPTVGSGTTTKPNQVHHYATNKSKTYTPQLEEIANRYGLDLDDAWNKDLLPHQGRHPNAYHEYVLDSMKQFDNIAQGDKDIFLKLFDNLKNNVKSNPDMLYKDYWK